MTHKDRLSPTDFLKKKMGSTVHVSVSNLPHLVAKVQFANHCCMENSLPSIYQKGKYYYMLYIKPQLLCAESLTVLFPKTIPYR